MQRLESLRPGIQLVMTLAEGSPAKRIMSIHYQNLVRVDVLVIHREDSPFR